jgi:hypothetical protein
MRPGLVGHRVRKRPDNIIVGDSVSERLKAARMTKEAASGCLTECPQMPWPAGYLSRDGWRGLPIRMPCGTTRSMPAGRLNAERLRPAGFPFAGMPPRYWCMPFRYARGRKRGIRTCKGPANRQIASLFGLAAWSARSLSKAAALAQMYWCFDCAWTKTVLEPRCPRTPRSGT